MSDTTKFNTDGYQPASGSIKQNGYQPSPTNNYGYQPVSQNKTPPVPPTSGSNAVPPKK